jgi:SAM-dependent methyltransferase
MSTPSSCDDLVPDISRALGEWFQGVSGTRLNSTEKEILERFAEDLFGYYLVHVQGVPDAADGLESCAIRNKLRLTTVPEQKGSDLCALGEQLPLQSDCVDAAVLRHTLDFAVDPQQVLREVERVLIPEGRVLIVGFNPFSLWGMWRLVLRWRGRVPWCGHFFTFRRVADWLGLLGFDIEYTDVTAFAPPLPERWQGYMGRLDRLGRRVWPMFAGVYVIRAVKRVSTVTPVKLHWRGLRVLSPNGSMVEPSARSGMLRRGRGEQ